MEQPKEYFFSLKDRKIIAEDTMAFWFDTKGTDFTFQAGQNAGFTLIDPPYPDPRGNRHPLSIASSPHHKDFLVLAMRMRDTPWKNSLKALPLGTNVKIDGPRGHMVLHDDVTKPAVFLAGGIGITPFRSMVEWATHARLLHKLILLYSNRNPASIAFLHELEEWTKLNPNLTLVPTITNGDAALGAEWKYERGMIDQAFLKKHVPDLLQAVYYIAGPPGMVVAMRKMLIGLGVLPSGIKLESFSGY